MIIAFYITLVALAVVVVAYERARQKSESRFFVERQQLQSKIDTLTEHLLQQAGQPIDLNRHMRKQFAEALAARRTDSPFRHGWKRDSVATPPKADDESQRR